MYQEYDMDFADSEEEFDNAWEAGFMRGAEMANDEIVEAMAQDD